MPTHWEQARIQKSLDYFDTFLQAFDPLIGNFNSNYINDIDRIHRIDPRPILAPDELRSDGRQRLLQRMTWFLKIIYEGPGSILVGWGYWKPGTGEISFPEVNRLQLDTRNEWRFYRFHEDIGLKDPVEGIDTSPYRLAKSLIERLAEVSAIPPERTPSLAL